ncbi:hypothetical protein N7488_000307 [Penicillium malachiteum]|nr:hypothetical protein N7488_000307 [Penicillium malachiteum]
MKAPEETTNGQVSSNEKKNVAPLQKKRPPKLAKRTRPSEEESEGSSQRQNGNLKRSNSDQSSIISKGDTQKDLHSSDISSLEDIPEKPQTSPRFRVQHHRTTIHRESTSSAEPDEVKIIEREKDVDSPEAWTRQTRVREILSPGVQNQQVVPAPDQRTGPRGELLSDGTNENSDQVIETTETVQNEQRNDQLKLRLDLNLDIEIELKAKIRGDLTLQLLQ